MNYFSNLGFCKQKGVKNSSPVIHQHQTAFPQRRRQHPEPHTIQLNRVPLQALTLVPPFDTGYRFLGGNGDEGNVFSAQERLKQANKEDRFWEWAWGYTEIKGFLNACDLKFNMLNSCF